MVLYERMFEGKSKDKSRIENVEKSYSMNSDWIRTDLKKKKEMIDGHMQVHGQIWWCIMLINFHNYLNNFHIFQ